RNSYWPSSRTVTGMPRAAISRRNSVATSTETAMTTSLAWGREGRQLILSHGRRRRQNADGLSAASGLSNRGRPFRGEELPAGGRHVVPDPRGKLRKIGGGNLGKSVWENR